MFGRIYKGQFFRPMTIAAVYEQDWQRELQELYELTASREDTHVSNVFNGEDREDIIESFANKEGKIVYWHLVNDPMKYGVKVFYFAEDMAEDELNRRMAKW